MSRLTHGGTPVLSVLDARAGSVRRVDYWRRSPNDDTQTLVTAQAYDVAGRLIARWDPRFYGTDTANLRNDYNLTGQPLRTRSVDGGWRLALPGLAGETLQRWDERGSHWRIAYDPQLRPVALEENSQVAVDTFIYADATADADHNLRGRLLEQVDPSGTLLLDSYSLVGLPLCETRIFHDSKAFTSRRLFGPSGAVLEQTDAGEHQQQSRYDLAGQLKQVQLRLKGQTDWQTVLHDAQYNAAGQIIEQHAGNSVISHWSYDPATARLLRQRSQKAPATALVDFEYVHDPMGNITRILDHTYTPTHFANQRVDGHRAFSYDSLYRLTSASGYDDGPPSDIPGLPQPTDPNNRLNYLQTYEYDEGGNLTKLTHVREGAGYTRQMFIDPGSNRGVRYQPGDPAPSFDTLFDRHGNLLALQPGQNLQWNARDQLEMVTLIDRENAANDQEHYRYSQGTRVYKRHETHTAKRDHFQDVRYLPGLEIRTRDNGEELHIIILDAGLINVRCLHWVTGKPADIDTDQLRYSLEDHSGSNMMELDQHAQLISHEGYYPFGATAWLIARPGVEVSYKTMRYSGKEMDISGLYYYGARYYAPWLQRWVSADPAGDVDGLNRYAFVANNPLRYVDTDGQAKAESVIVLYSGFLSELSGESSQLLGQLHNIIQQKGVFRSLMGNLGGELVKGVFGYETGVLGGEVVDLVLPDAPFTTPYTTTGGLIGGNVGGDVAGEIADPFVHSAGLVGALIPQTSKISVEAIDRRLGIEGAVKDIKNWRQMKDEVIHPALNSVLNPSFVMNRVMGSWIPIIGGTLNMFARAIEGEDIKNRLDPVKIGKIETLLADWKTAVEQRAAWAENAFDALGTDVISPADLLPNVNFMTSKEALAPISRAALRKRTQATLANIKAAQQGITAYKEMGTTDNLWASWHAHPVGHGKGRPKWMTT